MELSRKKKGQRKGVILKMVGNIVKIYCLKSAFYLGYRGLARACFMHENAIIEIPVKSISVSLRLSFAPFSRSRCIKKFAKWSLIRFIGR